MRRNTTANQLFLSLGLTALMASATWANETANFALATATASVSNDTATAKNKTAATTTDTLIKRPISIAFITPISTNGIESPKVTNQLSINIFAGYNGGLEGAEFGGFVNTIRHDVKGVQFAGFSNGVWGETRGGQFAGFSNTNRAYTEGIQAAGFLNVVIDSVRGGQFAGFTNATINKFEGVQASGFANFVGNGLKGVQASGFANVVVGQTTGVQAAGFANVTTTELHGVQVSGFANFAQRVNGSMIGMFNVADTLYNGVAIGFFSFIRKGYHKVEIGGSPSLYGTVSLKTGTRQFYNIFSLGAKTVGSRFLWAYGYGIGTEMSLGEKVDLNLDLVAYQVNEVGYVPTDFSLLNKLHSHLSYRINDQLAIYGGPSFNVLASNTRDNENVLRSTAIAPWTIFDQTYSRTNIKMYPGFNVGMRLF